MKGEVLYQEIERRYPDADDALLGRIHRAVDLVNEAAAPASRISHFDLDDGMTILGYALEGEDIRRHLRGATSLIVGACTLGAEIDRLLERMKLEDLATAFFVDLAASIAVEKIAETDWQEIRAQARAKAKDATTRYSCGYGDFPLESQAALLRLSGADKALKIQVNDGGMMYPTKSITYLVGILPTA